MPAASMDKFGRCPFVLARVAERGTGPQRLLIRSAQDCSPQRLFADVSVEVCPAMIRCICHAQTEAVLLSTQDHTSNATCVDILECKRCNGTLGYSM